MHKDIIPLKNTRNNILSDLVGSSVLEIIKGIDSYSILFKNGAVMGVFTSNNIDEHDEELVGDIVSSVELEEKFLLIKFISTICIIIRIDDDAYIGPEAISYRYGTKVVSF